MDETGKREEEGEEKEEKHRDACQGRKEGVIDWQKSVYLEAEPAEDLTIARDRKSVG